MRRHGDWQDISSGHRRSGCTSRWLFDDALVRRQFFGDSRPPEHTQRHVSFQFSSSFLGDARRRRGQLTRGHGQHDWWSRYSWSSVGFVGQKETVLPRLGVPAVRCLLLSKLADVEIDRLETLGVESWIERRRFTQRKWMAMLSQTNVQVAFGSTAFDRHVR